MKHALYAIVVLSMMSPVAAQAEPLEVRGLRWGMSSDEVLKVEKTRPVREAVLADKTSKLVSFDDVLAGLPVEVHLFFESDKLKQIRYDSREYASCEEIAKALATLQTGLTAKYGKPTEHGESGFSARDCKGHATWQIGGSGITLIPLSRGQYSFSLDYMNESEPSDRDRDKL